MTIPTVTVKTAIANLAGARADSQVPWLLRSPRALLVALLLGVVGLATGPRILSRLDERGTRPAAGAASPRAVDLYNAHFRNPRHERMFLASIAFFLAFAVIRAITHLIRAGRGPFHDLVRKEGHLHHLVWGILLLLGVGYLWLIQVGTGDAGDQWSSRITALLFGVASALTLDEFALWLTFRDVYWELEGRLSIDAVLLFGSLLSIAMWGGPFLADLLWLWGRVP